MASPRLLRRLLAATFALLTTGTVLSSTAPATAAWSPPGFVRSIGGRGEAGVYAFAMEYNEVTGEILVGDYWNFVVRRYDTNGRELGWFFLPPAQRHGQAYSVTTDPRNGHIYVTEFNEGDLQVGDVGWVSHWTGQGVFVNTVKLNLVYHAWAVADSAGKLVVADSHATIHSAAFPPKIRKYDLDNNYAEVDNWGTYGSDPGEILLVHGMDVDADDNVYAADAFNYRVNVWDPSGNFLHQFGSRGNALGQFTGDLRGLAIDRDNGWVYVVDAEASQIEKFELDGTPLLHWGTEGFGPGQFADGGRGITVDGDGNVWVADFGNFRFYKFSPQGALLATYPQPARSPWPGGFAQIRDVAVGPDGHVWAPDTWNHRLQEFSATGQFLDSWGNRNSHPPYGMNYPRGVAVDPATQNVWLVNTRDHVIRVYQPDGTYVRTIGSTLESNDPGSFSWPMDVEFYDGKAYVAGYYASYIKVLDASTGAEIQRIPALTNGVAVDPATGNIYNVTWRRDRVEVYNQAGTRLSTFGSAGSGNGQFQNPWDIDIVDGVVYVSDTQLKRIQAFDLSGTYLGRWGSNGSGAFQFGSPAGLAHDAAGNIYVADSTNDRILVFNHSVAMPSGDSTNPTQALSSPAQRSTVPAATVTLAGTAADAVGVAKVEVAIRNNATNRWWDARTASWATAKKWNIAALAGSTNNNMTFSLGFVGVERGRTYFWQARATDTSGNRQGSGLPSRTFTVSS